MAVPGFDSFKTSILHVMADGETRHWRDVEAAAAQKLELSEADFQETLPSGKPRITSRVQWAITYLFQAGLLIRPSPGHAQITERGRQVLAQHPDRVDNTVLSQFEEFREFTSRTRAKTRNEKTAESDDPDIREEADPLEVFAAAKARGDDDLKEKLISALREQHPTVLEKLVLRLFKAMGYGRDGSLNHVGGPGDGGVDGIILQDRLGLEHICVQAKRYAEKRTVGDPEVRDFLGALDLQRAQNGIIVTTGSFTKEALGTIEKATRKIIPIGGERLAELLIQYDIGVRTIDTYTLKDVDHDFLDRL